MTGFQFPPPPPPPPKACSFDHNGQWNERDEALRRDHGQARRGYNGRSHGFGRPIRGGSSLQYSSNHCGNPSSFNADAAGPSTWQQDHGSVNVPRPAVRTDQTHVAPGNSSPNVGSEARPRTVAAHKRKLEALRNPQQDYKNQYPPTVPTVPSFCSPVLSRTPAFSQEVPIVRSQKKRTQNALGLTPQNEYGHYSSSESDADDDDVDEEAVFAKLGMDLTFEYNGTATTLRTTADLAAWRHERNRNFPTRERLVNKMEQKRQIGEARRRLLTGASSFVQAAMTSALSPRLSSTTTEAITERKYETSSHTPRLPEELKEKKKTPGEQKSQLKGPSSPVIENGDLPFSALNSSPVQEAEHISLPNETGSDRTTEPRNHDFDLLREGSNLKNEKPPHGGHTVIDALEESHKAPTGQLLGASDPASIMSPVSSSDRESDDSGPPEEATSRRPPTENGSNRRLCRYYVAGGYCRDGDSCRFVHDLPVRSKQDNLTKKPTSHQTQHIASTSRGSQVDLLLKLDKKSIHDRLVEQEQNQQNVLALRVIKYLGKAGLFS